MTGPVQIAAPTQSMRCAMFSRDFELDPGGSALRLDEIIVAEVPLPWPKPVFDKHGFEGIPGLVSIAKNEGRRVRVLASVPESPQSDLATVSVHRRRADSLGFSTARHGVGPSDVPRLVASLLEDGLDSSPNTLVVDGADPRELLVCTQGSHDVCCGAHGTSLASDPLITESGLTITRVSHIGGHRYAPVVISLPEGRMWGMVDAATMRSIVDQTVSPNDVARSCRGWLGAEPGPAQMAERAVMAAVDDWGFDRVVRRVEVESVSGDFTRCRVETPDANWHVVVGIGREAPLLTCGSADEPRHESERDRTVREWTIVSVERSA